MNRAPTLTLNTRESATVIDTYVMPVTGGPDQGDSAVDGSQVLAEAIDGLCDILLQGLSGSAVIHIGLAGLGCWRGSGTGRRDPAITCRDTLKTDNPKKSISANVSHVMGVRPALSHHVRVNNEKSLFRHRYQHNKETSY